MNIGRIGMNNIKVTLISNTVGSDVLFEPEELTAIGKRICNSNETLEELTVDATSQKIDWRNKQTLKEKHMGILEHISFTFLIEGGSRVMTHQLVRHRMASYLQMSQRVVPMKDLNLIIPPDIQGTEWKSIWMEKLKELKEIYEKMDAEKKPDGSKRFDRGDIRYIMPHAMETRIWMTINGRSLCHFLKERLINPHAQWEIKEVARQMYELAHLVCPTLINLETSECWE